MCGVRTLQGRAVHGRSLGEAGPAGSSGDEQTGMKPEEGRIETARVNREGERNLANQQEIGWTLPLVRGTRPEDVAQIDIDIRPSQMGNSPGSYTDRTLSNEQNSTAESR